MIHVKRTADGDPLRFTVAVKDAGGETHHAVTMTPSTYERLADGEHTPEECIEAAFRFLLDREPKEAILGQFDVTLISHYFPEFEARLPEYLARD